MDADLWVLLTEEEEAEYLARSVRAAAQRCADLVPCPAPGCDGLAVAGGAKHGFRYTIVADLRIMLGGARPAPRCDSHAGAGVSACMGCAVQSLGLHRVYTWG